MSPVFIILSAIVPLVLSNITKTDLKSTYCGLQCKYQHTVCKRAGRCGPVKGCEQLPLTTEFRQLILDAHNELRHKIATGADTRGGNGAASNMNALSYDVELEYVAQCWINRCRRGHDKCRSTKKFKTPGQNFAVGTMTEDRDARLKFLVGEWYNEITNGNADVVGKFRPVSNYGHFSQVVWGRTTHIGCGYSFHKKRNLLFLLCNYNLGNVLGEPMYKKGSACSACEGGRSCNSKYNGLCGNADMDNSESPPYFGDSSKPLPNYFIIICVILVNVFMLKRNVHYY